MSCLEGESKESSCSTVMVKYSLYTSFLTFFATSTQRNQVENFGQLERSADDSKRGAIPDALRMGKYGEQPNLQLPQNSHGSPASSRTFCPMCLQVNLRCIVVLILSSAVLLTGLFWVLPLRSRTPGFDAKDSIKLSATVQASFKLEKPVAELIPLIARLEYDISGEIGAPDSKVLILSMHQAGSPNYTNVIFGVVSDSISVPFNPASLAMLKSLFIDLFVQLSNLSLTTSIFGETSDFQILKFPGGVSIIPTKSASIWQVGPSLFNFTINHSISEIQRNYVEFQEQLKGGLHLKSNEHLYVEVSSKEGSTISPPITVQTSVVSDIGIMLPDRLKQLAQIITGSHSVNLGLDNSVFGKVKSVILSSYLKDIEDNPPSPSPAPSPGPSYPPQSPSPCPESKHHRSSPPPAHSPRTHHSHSPRIAPRPSPSHSRPNSRASAPRSSSAGKAQDLVSPSLAPSPSSSVRGQPSCKIWLLGTPAIILIHLFKCL